MGCETANAASALSAYADRAESTAVALEAVGTGLVSSQLQRQTLRVATGKPEGRHRAPAGAVIAGVLGTALLGVAVLSDLDSLRSSFGSDALLYGGAVLILWSGVAVWMRAQPGLRRRFVTTVALLCSVGLVILAQREGGSGADLLSVGTSVIAGDCAGTKYVFPAEPPEDFDPGSQRSLQDSGGAVASPALVEVQLASRDQQAVTIRRIDFEVASASEIKPGSAVYGYPCGDTVAARFLAYDLDRGRTLASSETEADVRGALLGDDPGRPVALTPMVFPFDVTGSENLTLVLGAVTERDVEWRAVIHWARGGQSGTAVVDNGGEPFRVAGTEGLERLFYQGPGSWLPPQG